MKPYYQDALTTLYHADCRDVLEAGVLPSAIPVVLTDPPYVSGARRDAEKTASGRKMRYNADAEWFSHDQMTIWGFSWFMRSMLTHLACYLAPGAHLYIFTDWRQTPNLYGMLESCGYRVNHCLVWDKMWLGLGQYWRNQHEHIVFASTGNPLPMRRKDAPAVLSHPNVAAANRLHPTEKPLDLLTDILNAVPDGMVLDLFAGSGSTLEAAKRLGRPSIGCEVDEKWCEVAATQLAKVGD